VGFCLVRNTAKAVEIVDFMLSCRVQSKFIEQALFSHLLDHHNPRGTTAIWVNFHQTGRNTPARRVLEAIGFRPCNSAEDGFDEGMILHESLKCNFIEVRCFAPSTTLRGENDGAGADISHTDGAGE
jgi:predicted enzyme involved in methoxymalonyl-ACP biosynthesis